MRVSRSLLALLTAAPLLAAAPPDRPKRFHSPHAFFRLADVNRDARLTFAELRAAEARLRQADTDRDGKLSGSEYLAVEKAMRERQAFDRADTDGDGRLSAKERTSGQARADVNDDGFVDLKEYLAWQGAIRREQIARHIRRQIDRIMRHDANNDGRVSQKEIGYPDRVFGVYDTNGDGFLEPEELMQRWEPEGIARQVAAYVPRTGFFALAEADGDERVTRQELAAGFRRLREADADRDGAVSHDEYERVMEAVRQVAAFFYRDADRDGRLSAEEFNGEEYFDVIDTNRDGFIDPAEYGRWQELRRLQLKMIQMTSLLGQDTDGDGRVTPAEFRGTPSAFGMWDTNRDGFIDKSDFDEGAGRNTPPKPKPVPSDSGSPSPEVPPGVPVVED